MAVDYAPLEEVYTPSPEQQEEVVSSSARRTKKTTFNPNDLFENDKTECNFILILFIFGATILMIRR